MLYLHLFMCTMCFPGASGIQKRALGPWNGVTDGCEATMWVLGIESAFSTRATSALNY